MNRSRDNEIGLATLKPQPNMVKPPAGFQRAKETEQLTR